MVNDKVKQIRTDALVAEYIYTVKIKELLRFTVLINVLTIILPIIVFAVLLVLKGTVYEGMGNIASIILSAVLLGLVVLSLILKTDDKKMSYNSGRKDNIYVANEALKLLDEDDKNLIWFYNYIVEMDSRDSANIGNVGDGLKKTAYRRSLMKLIPGSTNVVCAICKASPFVFKKGSCQVCGNMPKEAK